MAHVIRFPTEQRWEMHGKGDGSPAEVFQFKPNVMQLPADIEPSDGYDPTKWPPADMLYNYEPE